tara:strand:- start:275 stop:436 length:162 start_codon:yes stop_codon:yes gene_type:complete
MVVMVVIELILCAIPYKEGYISVMDFIIIIIIIVVVVVVVIGRIIIIIIGCIN